MIVRFTSIVILKWLVSYFILVPAVVYIIPSATPSLVRDLIVWIVTALLALVFAEWAFNTKLPEKKDVIELFVIWLIVSAVLSMGTDVLMYGQPIFLLKSFQTQLQFVLELIMVPVAAYIARKRRMAHASGEGLSS